MATAVVMPRLSDTMTEGKILKWHKKEGDPVGSGEAIADVETDKATLELEAYDEGTLLKIVVPEGQSAPLGAPVAIIGKPGEDFSALLAAAPTPAPPPAPAAKPEEKPVAAPPPPSPAAPAPSPVSPKPSRAPEAPAPAPAPRERARVSPLARRLARERGVDLDQVAGSGPAGRVVARDVEEAARRPAPAPAPVPSAPAAARPSAPAFLTFPEQPAEGGTELTGMRKVIATRTSQAWAEAPHFFLAVEIDMESCAALREELKGLGLAVSLNDFVLKAAALGLRKVPEVNRSFANGRLEQHGHADVGMAVALPDGLVTPVLHDADRLPLPALAALSRDLAERARTRRLKPEEYQGGSVTVSNLGMFGVDQFFAVLNPPQSAILAVGKVSQRPAVHEGRLVARSRMWLTLSGDHRAIDGALGARYLGAVREALERPVALMA